MEAIRSKNNKIILMLLKAGAEVNHTDIEKKVFKKEIRV